MSVTGHHRAPQGTTGLKAHMVHLVCRALLSKRTSQATTAKSRKVPPQKKAKLQVEGKDRSTTCKDKTSEHVH